MLAAENYGPVFFRAVLLLTVVVCLRLRAGRIGGPTADRAFWCIGAMVILFLGLRPVSPAFGDTMNYAAAWERLGLGEEPPYEWGFSALMKLGTDTISIEQFFLVCAVIYVVPLMLAARHRHRSSQMEVLLAFVGAFSFFAYGVNGVRSGMAASLFISGMARAPGVGAILLMVAATSVHKSAFLSIAAWAASSRIRDPRFWMAAWVAALAASTIGGATVSAAIASLPGLASDERAQVYFGTDATEVVGLRLDFVLYSIVPVLVTERLAGRSLFLDPFYVGLRNVYLGLNAFWLLTMYAAYTNRFAYLSWSLLPWVIVYPFVKQGRTAVRQQAGVVSSRRLEDLAWVLLASVAFTYLMMMYVYPARER